MENNNNLQHLPVDDNPIPIEEEIFFNKYFDISSKPIKENPKIFSFNDIKLYLLILFIYLFINIPFFDKLLSKIINDDFIRIIIKSLIFILILFILQQLKLIDMNLSF